MNDLRVLERGLASLEPPPSHGRLHAICIGRLQHFTEESSRIAQDKVDSEQLITVSDRLADLLREMPRLMEEAKRRENN
ncbi:MAG: hypothetical protein A2Y57_03625 [Candidatus Woykebacteria bacterium RBG_13_40_7b]|uniref:Uncharacterized protein n=1 Tax=Candidatus Woykebacteria bacterium RBG_13_40_7b TaxID=1802594 RepID=A0A1G1WAQ4_9BACT|nr:MAG: hypothetical protein A2Y57_03625 [Candidatus Woykebacteria bacterium RBG_13_40_7b]